MCPPGRTTNPAVLPPTRGRRNGSTRWTRLTQRFHRIIEAEITKATGPSAGALRPGFAKRCLGVSRTRVSFQTYVWDASRVEGGAGVRLDRVEREDEVIVEAVQRDTRSRLYDRGRYSPRREQGVHHFHSLLVRALAEA